AAQRIAKGKHTQVDIIRHDEIGQLSSAFNVMAEQIENSIADLKKARDQAVEASQTKSRFLANMSHELRTPLNAIIGYSEMLMDEAKGREDQDSLEDAQNIHIAGVNLLGIINDILNISKLEAKKVELFVENFSLEDLLLEVKASVNSLTITNNNQFEISALKNNLTLNTDRAKIRQILINLLSNAMKFTKNGHINLVLDLIDAEDANKNSYRVPYLKNDSQIIVPHEFKGGKVLVFSVQDNGIGMKQEQCQRIFEEFTQADNTITRSYGGTGLGLALVRHFSAMIFCRLELASEPDRGSAFTIKMPLEWPAKEAPADQQ
ncbi:HAMP domain-containing protein, partial [bacterium]|nr:HAMP domain-containing protein [bacterium]